MLERPAGPRGLPVSAGVAWSALPGPEDSLRAFLLSIRVVKDAGLASKVGGVFLRERDHPALARAGQGPGTNIGGGLGSATVARREGGGAVAAGVEVGGRKCFDSDGFRYGPPK